ncbi:MAG: sigma-70 family RNA polymerase sigma factor [Desulfobacula sp.]|uniref:RNA polymerase sigma factor n=1 Tax=Desulfobacula sp. TaxID=2593537 RepID=UPI001E0B6BD2|nr:sigma-70 family RNA polymerase sigma factor [Desulfobacula sp.]MBT3484844.1 sigma-70 family RNA polymerase sigma factor [Desulfobacula sp.]MBT3804686.1 sigma-70 family RNA polymerase sigma factor [Desulfobacula sp.]MBT4024036.1 sigma-70 family RNA polymerase sigma factor [Desulfobacula sp.]MBT4198398.1 sigma-70 family RNA polymerase sigma factor [Desulfobacula sp.]
MNKIKANADDINELDLVERLKKGQQWAFDVLVKQYQNRLLKIAYGITLDREDSLEVVQDVFISVFKNIHTFRQDASLSTWLRKITINQCLNWKRKWKRKFKWNHESIESENDQNLFEANIKSNDPEILYRKKQFEKNLMKLIKKLPEKTRMVLVLNAFEGLSYEEIAKTLNIKKGTVSSRLYSARKKLVNSLGMSNERR